MTLAGRILLLVALALVPALLIQGYNEYELRAAREDSVRAETLRIAGTVAEQLEQLGMGVRQVLGLVAQEKVVQAQEPAGCTEYLARAKAELPGSILIAVTKPDGTLVCNSAGSAPSSYSNAERAYHQRAIATGAFAVGDYVEGVATGKRSIHFAQPIRDPGGAVIGVVLASIELGWLAERLSRIGVPPDTALSVIDGNGTVLVRLPDHESWVGRAIPPERLATIAENVGRARDAIAWDGRRRIVGIRRPAPPLDGLTISVGRDRDSAFADVNAATWRGLVLILVGGVAALAGGLAAAHLFIRRPVARLIGAAESWRRGDLGTRTGLAGSSEFGRLGAAFDAMAASLQQHEDELKVEAARSRALQEQQTTMLHELNHRVKNTLATVQSLARQSKGGAGQGENLERRIIALSKTHDLLTRDDWSGAPLREVLENELGPYRNGADHLRLEGPPVNLPPRYVLALGMTFHELTTNAAKYGALSGPAGRVGVTWRSDGAGAGERRLRLEWRESGGPPVAPPERRGFGTRLIAGGVGRELGGEITLDFAPSGLVCLIDVPLDAAA